MQTASPTQPARSTFAARFARFDPSGTVRAVTAALVNIWPKGHAPRSATVASERGAIMSGKKQPVASLYKLTIGALDEGKSVEVATKWAVDLIAAAKAYAERKPRQTAGILPIRQVHDRLLVSAIREDAEADCREATVDLDSIASLEQARAERLDAMEKDERKVELYTARIAELRLRGA